MGRALSTEEIGATGLRIYSGRVDEEFLRQLRGRRGLQIFREMRDNDAVVGAVLFAVEMLIRQVTWTVEAASSATADQEVAEFVQGCLADMNESWPDVLSSILSFLPFGFSIHEEVYKVRNGDTLKPEDESQFTDGRLGWKKLPIRAQETIERWELEPHGGVIAVEQVAPPVYARVIIPANRFLHFRTTTEKGNPLGRSVLRAAWRSWAFKKRIEEIEGIGIERDLAGLPVVRVPLDLLMQNANASDRALAEDLEKLARNIRRDEKEGILFPLAYDEAGRELYKLELLTTGGRRQFETTEIVGRYNSQIAMTVLADFVLLGHEKVGSFALASSKTSLFSVALGAWLDSIAEVFNRFAIPRLLRLNAFNGAKPRLVHGDVESVDLVELGQYINQLSGAGAPLFPNRDLEQWLLRQAGAPDAAVEAAGEEPIPPAGEEDEDLENPEGMGDQGDDDEGEGGPPPAAGGGAEG
jgi:hypothetical protein